MRLRQLIESLADWGTEWVHFTDHPMMTVNPKPTHMDPSGIYFFPAKFTSPYDIWHKKKYAFVATIAPTARILDCSRVSEAQIWQMINAAGIADVFKEYITRYPPKDMKKMFDMAWEQLQRRYYLDLGRKPAAFNAMLRSLGWDAIFDDTGAIHSAEPQLLVLDRRIITSIRSLETRPKGSKFSTMQQVLTDLQQLGSQYGKVKVSPIRKPKSTAYYADRDNIMMARVDIGDNDKYWDQNLDYEERQKFHYANLKVYIPKDNPDLIKIYLEFSNPRLNYGVGNEYHMQRRTYLDPLDGARGLKRALDKIFHGENKNENQ